MANDFERVKQAAPLNLYAGTHLEKRRRHFVCPVCNSGNSGRANSDSAFSIKGDRWHCFSCGSGGDVFDLAGIVHKTDDKSEQLRVVAEWANVPLEAPEHREGADLPPKGIPEKTEEKPRPYAARRTECDYIMRARESIGHLEAVAYLASRGITEADAKSAGLGYDPERKRLVIPWKGTDYYHIDRDVTGRARAKYTKPKADDVGPQPLYNPQALEGEALFVVEGALDALAVELCGFPAVALGGTAGRQLVEALASKPRKPSCVLLLDSDDAGRRAARELAESLEGVSPYRLAETPGAKDAAELFASDRKALESFLGSEFQQAAQEARRKLEEGYRRALEHLSVVPAGSVARAIVDGRESSEPVQTGIRPIDMALDGGLPRGLVVLGAVSSTGKTTLVLQMADSMASQGIPVLFVTIEQSAAELVAKSLSRLVSLGSGLHIPAGDLRRTSKRALWKGGEFAALVEAESAYYGSISPKLRIMEGQGQPGVADIAAAARLIAAQEGQPPAVFVDYLQLLRPEDPRDSDKQATDKNVMSLRQLARELSTPVVAISSLNRSSYSGAIDLESFKESGAIEYGADLLLGLQPYRMAEELEDIASPEKAKNAARKTMREHKAKENRDCELVILKNRNGRIDGEGVPLTFHAQESRFGSFEG